MDRPQHTDSAIEDLRLIREEAKHTHSLDTLRVQFERLQAIRRLSMDDFDLQVVIADIHHEIIERARYLRGDIPSPVSPRAAEVSALFENPAAPKLEPKPDPAPEPGGDPDAVLPSSEIAVIPPEVPRVDTQSWRMVVGLALFLTMLVLVGFFYLIQTARKLNFKEEEAAAAAAAAAKKPKLQPAAAAAAPAPIPITPTLRLYTDLVPGAVTVDELPPQSLPDGELVLDNLQAGQHSIKVAGRSGLAAFKFEVVGKSAPTVTGAPTASNAMVVLVSVQDSHGRLTANAAHSTVVLDGKPAGEVGPDGLALTDLGKADHDLQVIQNRDRQRFVLTYTPAPVLTVFVKSDPNAGTLTVSTGQDNVEVYIDEALYRRRTEHGLVRILLKVGKHRVRVHKSGFTDALPQTVEVKKAEETAVQFQLVPAPDLATLQIKGALPGTSAYIDKEFTVLVGGDGTARVPNIKAGDHTIELRHDQAQPKTIVRTFHAGESVVLTGSDVTLDRLNTDSKPPVTPPPTPPANPVSDTTRSAAAHDASSGVTGMSIDGERVLHGGGFIPYHTPKAPGRYSFQAQGRVGGFLKRGKLQWYAGYQDNQNYVLFSVDGKHASVREVRDGRNIEWGRIPFPVDSAQWIQVDLSVRANTINARIKTSSGTWSEIGPVSTSERDFTQGRVGLYVPGNDSVAVANFKFANH